MRRAAFLGVLCLAWGLLLASLPAVAGVLAREDVAARFGPPWRVGEKLREVPAWPLTSELSPDAGPLAYVFESIDLAPIPGFEGTPFNLLVAIDAQGVLLEVEVLSQHEPVFLGGLGEAPLREFVRQYAGKPLSRQFVIASGYGQRGADGQEGGGRVVLDGVSKATASIRIVNQSVLVSALAVARERLAFAAPAQAGPPARARADTYESLDYAALLQRGYVQRLTLRQRDVEALFAGSAGAGLDPQALQAPDAVFGEYHVAYLNPPSIGRALLGDAAHAALLARLEPGQHAYWVASVGQWPLTGETFVRGTVPARLSLHQDGVPHEARDLDLLLVPPAGAPAFDSMLALQLPPLSGLDPGQPVRFGVNLVRSRGVILPEVTVRTAGFDYAPPAALLDYPPRPLPEWLQAWRGRAVELAVIALALVALSVVLARPRAISRSPRRLRRFRQGFLAFTLVFIGWYAQGQLSIVQLTGAVKSLAAGQGLGSFLYDPVSLLLIAFTALTLVVWGRGTFCGWLCPFGALQEFAAQLGQWLGRRTGLRLLRPRRLPSRLAGALARGRYVLLAALLLCAVFAPAAGAWLAELEPFKTAITVGFARSAPFVAYALALLLLGAIYYKFFCRFICPLGAALTLGGKLRVPDWLVRRKECGQPCQTCRHRCAYDAIARDGRIRYDDCFQCLDCVGIYHDETRCAPLILQRKKAARS